MSASLPTPVYAAARADPSLLPLPALRLVEDSDFKHAEELFSDTRNPDDLSPSTLAEMEDYGRLVAAKLLNKHQVRWRGGGGAPK